MSTINDIGIPGVGSGILHPKHKNRWRITFANMGGGADSQPVSMQAKSVTRPKLTFQEIELHRYNSRAWVAGKHEWNMLTLVLEDDVTSTASAVVQQQLQNQQWLIGAEGQWLAAAGEGSLYKFVTYLDMLDGNEQVIEKWTVEGCWLQDTEYGDVDYTANEAVTITCQIRYDHARQLLGGYQQGPGVATGGAGRVGNTNNSN
ncbi:MAG: hypothetical protein E4H14_01125 [Candidatus Thorarchaeota archaeon]|nr:MAG: hypothetical protein E4H14_01125 [Candidatus Thorarchaeota archaeon]